MAMQAEIKAKWIEALESGKYGQFRGGWGGDGMGYCCLQVLRVVVLGLEDGDDQRDNRSDDVRATGLGDYRIDRCIAMNDCELLTFPEIAAWVRDNVETVETMEMT